MAFEYKVLIVDDEPMSTHITRKYLSENYFVIAAENGRQGLELAQTELPDLILLDLDLPEADGYQVCQCLRTNEQTRDIPIIIVSGNTQIQNRVRIFGLGADDFVAKPFNVSELLARVESKVRRIKEKHQITEFIQCANLNIDIGRREVRLNQNLIYLSVLEFDLLVFLVKNKNRILNRNQILSGVWKGCAVSKRTIDTHILSLRKKMVNFEWDIVSVYGVGYGVKERDHNRKKREENGQEDAAFRTTAS